MMIRDSAISRTLSGKTDCPVIGARLEEIIRLAPNNSTTIASEFNKTLNFACDLLNASADSIHIFDENGVIVELNSNFSNMLKSKKDKVVGTNLDRWYDEKSIIQVRNLLGNISNGESSANIRIELKPISGTTTTLETTLKSFDSLGKTFYFATSRDISKRILQEEKMRLKATAFSHSKYGVVITSPNGKILDVNETFSKITGYHRHEVIGKNPRIFGSGKHNHEFYAAMWSTLTQDGYWHGEIWNKRKSGDIYPEILTIAAVRDFNGVTQNYVGTFTDITPLKQHEKHLEHIAHYDVLTDLPNRLLLTDRLKQAILQHQRGGPRFAVVYIDLDGFKSVNDAYGHEVGDSLLTEVATNMKNVLRDADTLSRFGGDEFVALLLGLNSETESFPYLDRLLEAAAREVRVGTLSMSVTASLGVSFYPGDKTNDSVELLRQADHAMYLAKMSGKNRYKFFQDRH